VSFSSIPFYRYILPATVLLYAFAAIGVVWMIRLIDGRVARHAVFAMVLVAVMVWQADRVSDFDRQFVDDSRDALAKWVRRTLAPGTLVVADGYTELNRGVPNQTPARVIRTQFAADVGSVDQLLSRGVRFVAVASSSYDRFTSRHTRGAAYEQREFEVRQQFYRELFHKYPVVWMHRAEHPMHTFTNPDILVFRLREPD
jgi:hypothetical protein